MNDIELLSKYISELAKAEFRYTKSESEDRIEYSIFGDENELILTITMYKQWN